MQRLRIVAIASNLALILYAVVAHLQPIFVLRAVLLPLNVVRLMQIEMASATSGREERGPGHGFLAPATDW
jgi:hypothetical protein